MMKSILSIVVLLAIAGFIAAQNPPTLTPQACVAPGNVTGFCQNVWTYTILNNTNLATAATTAQNQYNVNVAKITNATAACMTALTAFACQSSLARCGRYTNYANVLQTRCDAVNTACGISGFPTNFTGNPCVANELVTVDGRNAVCVATQATTLGAACAGNIFDPKIVAPTVVVNSICPAVSSCNTTGTTSTCVRPSNLGEACISTCVSGTAQPGSALACIAGTCQYTGKRQDYPCLNNAECLSGNCTAGKCYESSLGGPCTASTQCRNNLYCDTKNSTCYNAAQQGELCGFVQPNWSNVPCLAGFTCVRTDNATSRCAPNANIGQACSDATGASVYDRALCAPSTLPNTGVARCVNDVCSVVAPGGQGAACNSTNTCLPTFTCQYATGATQGTCVTPGNVVCDTVGGGQCNQLQKCTCTDLSSTGTCAPDTSNPLFQCAAQQLGLQQCLLSKCQTVLSAFVPYDGYSCGATQCITQVNAYFCCVKNAIGTNYVAPTGQPTDPCITPTPTPGPTGPTTTSTPGPGQSSKRSGASTVAVSVVAMIIAIVAFCL